MTITAQETLAVRKAETSFNLVETAEELNALEAAEQVHLAAIKAARAEWDAVEDGEAKDVATDNANDTMNEFREDDDLTWLRIALASLDR